MIMGEEVIKVAEFQFDTTRLETSLSALQDSYFNLKKEAEGYGNQIKLSQKLIVELTKENLALAASGKATSDAYKENEKSIEELLKAEQQQFKNQQNTIANMARIRTELTATNKQLNAYMNSEGEQTTLIAAGNVALSKQIANINQARASNTELLRVRNQLNPSIAQEAKLITDLNKKLDQNNKFIKENASEYEKQKIGIGDYAGGIKSALGELGLLNGTLGNAQQALMKITPLFSGLKDEAAAAFSQLKGGTVATEGLSKAQIAAATTTNVVTGAMKLFRLALISTGIGAIVVLLGSLIAYFSQTQAGIDKLTAVTRPLQAIFSALMGVLSGLGEALVETFSNPKKAIEDFAKLIKENLINRFTALGDIIDGIINLDFDKVAESTVQAVTGVDNLAGKVRNAASETAKFLEEAAAKGAEIDRLTKEQEKAQLAYNKAQIEFGDALDKNNLIIKDTSKSFAERAKAAEENIRLSEENGKQEAYILELQLKRLKIEQSLKGEKNLTNAERQEEIDLLVKIDEAEDRGINARLENSRVLAGLEKERRDAAKKAHDEELKRIKEQQDKAIAAMQTELQFYIASNGERKKSMSDTLEYERVIMERSLAISKAEFDAKKLTYREYQLAVLEIQNEFASKSVELAVENADRELELFMLANQRRLEEGQFFSDSLYMQELDRINRIAEAEAAAQTLRFQNGLISAEEYALEIAKIDDKYYQEKQAVDAERKEAVKVQQAADVLIQDEINAERFDYDLGLQMERFNRQYAQEKELAIAQGANMIEFEKLQAKKKKEIEQDVQNNKLELASNAFGQLAGILGEESAAGKAAAVAQATIDTFKAANSAYASLAVIPVIGPALGAVAAGAAVVAGIANVKNILKVKPATMSTTQRPSYAQGGVVEGLGTGTSDNVEANLSVGERVMTARAQAMFPNLLENIERQATDPSFVSPILTQNSISGNGDLSQMGTMIAEAVATGAAIGTEKGSQKGIRDLSTDRQIMADARN